MGSSGRGGAVVLFVCSLCCSTPPTPPLKVANNRVSTYSGGMKRRLSVALAFLGDPKVVFLGEAVHLTSHDIM